MNKNICKAALLIALGMFGFNVLAEGVPAAPAPTTKEVKKPEDKDAKEPEDQEVKK